MLQIRAWARADEPGRRTAWPQLLDTSKNSRRSDNNQQRGDQQLSGLDNRLMGRPRVEGTSTGTTWAGGWQAKREEDKDVGIVVVARKQHEKIVRLVNCKREKRQGQVLMTEDDDGGGQMR